MKRYVEILKSYFRYSVMVEMEYKFNFFFGGLFELIWLGMYIVFINVIFLGASSIGGWSKYQMLLLTFQGGLTDAVITMAVIPALYELPINVNTGKLDFIILRPINKRFNISINKFNLSEISNIVINITGLIYCTMRLHLRVTFYTIIGYIILTLSGMMIIYSIVLMLMSLSFWWMRMDIVYGVGAELITIGNKPYTIYPKIFQKLITYGIPILVAFNYPILYLAKQQFPLMIASSLLISGAWFILSNITLKRGLRKYVSTGC